MDFDELLDQFLESISHIVDNLPSGEDVMDAVHDKLQSFIDNIEISDINLSDDQSETLINKLSDVINEPADSVRNAIEAVQNSDNSVIDQVDNEVTDINPDKFKGEPNFTGICWDECLVSLGTGSKRYYGGYYG